MKNYHRAGEYSCLSGSSGDISQAKDIWEKSGNKAAAESCPETAMIQKPHEH
jgi:hypothetical protein